MERVHLNHRSCSFSIQTILENGLIPGGKESHKGRHTIFFTPLNPFSGDPEEEELPDDYTVPQKVHYHSHWKRDQDVVYRVKLSRAQDQGLQFWQTKSQAIILNDPVLAECIYKVISQNGDRFVMMCRLAQGNLCIILCHQDASLQDEAKMNEINEKFEKLIMGSCAKSIRYDLSKSKMIFSEESSRAIYEMGNMELIELNTNLGDCSMFFLLEARTRKFEHVSMRPLASQLALTKQLFDVA